MGNRVTSEKATFENGEVDLAGALGFSAENETVDFNMVTQAKQLRER